MLRIGITGGVGMGKSTVAAYLERRGEFIIDTDQLARDLVRAGQPALSRIKLAFGESVLARDGSLNRSALAQIVFADGEKRRLLEEILHPRIREAWQSALFQRAANGARRSVVVIPLLFETGAEKELDLVICVGCSSKTQRDRLRLRGWGDQEIERRCAAQRPIREKMDSAHRVVWTEFASEISEWQVDRIFNAL